MFKWSEEKRTAALLFAEGNLTDAQIASRVGVCRTTLWNWKRLPEFASTIENHLETFQQEVRRRGLASRDRRIKALNDRWNRLLRIVEERASDPSMAGVPGGETGLLLHNTKAIGSGEKSRFIDFYEVDTGLLKELRELEKQAAQELGQWVESQEIKPLMKAYVTMGPDDL